MLPDLRHRAIVLPPRAVDHGRRNRVAVPPGVCTEIRRTAGCWPSRQVVDEAERGVAGRSRCGRLVPRQVANAAASWPSTAARLATRACCSRSPAARQIRCPQDMGAERLPFPLVLDRDQHRRAVRVSNAPYGQMDGCARPMRCGARPVPSKYSSGTFIQSAMPSNRLTFSPAPPGDAARRSAPPARRHAPPCRRRCRTPTRRPGPGPPGAR